MQPTGPSAWTGWPLLLAASLIGWPVFCPAARAQIQPILLECRVAQGTWQPCQMELIDPGRRWTVVVGRRRFDFQHDGTGHMRMGANGRWREVTPRWGEDRSLCWDGLCARGEIPLD